MHLLTNELKIFIHFMELHENIILLFVPVILVTIPLFVKFSFIPNTFQSILELLFEFLDSQLRPMFHTDEDYQKWKHLLIGFFFYVLLSNLIGLIPGLHSMTANILITSSLAILVISISIINGLIKKGPVKYLVGLTPSNTHWTIRLMMFPMELLSLVTKPFSLALRLYANMFAGHTIILVILSLTNVFNFKLFIPFDIVIVTVLLLFEIFVSLIQAFIFSYLSTVYITEGMYAH